jgi:transposase
MGDNIVQFEESTMASPYSDDLRQKAVDTVDRGERKSQVCRMLNISRDTLDLWLKRRQDTGAIGFHNEISMLKGCQI